MHEWPYRFPYATLEGLTFTYCCEAVEGKNPTCFRVSIGASNSSATATNKHPYTARLLPQLHILTMND